MSPCTRVVEVLLAVWCTALPLGLLPGLLISLMHVFFLASLAESRSFDIRYFSLGLSVIKWLRLLRSESTIVIVAFGLYEIIQSLIIVLCLFDLEFLLLFYSLLVFTINCPIYWLPLLIGRHRSIKFFLLRRLSSMAITEIRDVRCRLRAFGWCTAPLFSIKSVSLTLLGLVNFLIDFSLFPLEWPLLISDVVGLLVTKLVKETRRGITCSHN